ncbi:AAA family ATPase [Bathymodiolus septemdierum thioautotrophic gill symbiont]|uniref:ATPase, AAA family n=1 Tax=endosymbiont of Bathymodiolus septemdierum str. Myojin knoll TaxID=1303921 RepID=A0A0N7KBF6_9GAMM|nr:MoxR family ATPase [Bathymodiolus septemdierum thioautotrophic gill symbiont]BAS67879.1 ATPase, AAA family [endosymbiont of Bathymodiolus septemdierum str. Myojin knoll]
MRPQKVSTILNQEFESVELGHHTPVMLWGVPGIGKSQIIAEVANTHKVNMIDIRLSQMEPSDLRGIPFKNGEQVDWAIPSLLPDAKRHGEKGILFLDEITSAAPTVSAAAYQLILDRRLGDYIVPDGWVIFAAGNRQGDRGVTYSMPAPLANRFSHYTLEVNLDDWVAWAYQNNIDERIIGFLRYRPEHLFEFDPAHNPVAFPSPRTWEFTHRALQKFDNNLSLFRSTASACVGEVAGVEVATFIEHLADLPDLDAIVNGETVSIPDAIDLQYAICSALVGRAISVKGADNAQVVWGNILNFAKDFPQKELGVMLVSDMQRAIGEQIFSLPEFADWAGKIADVMFD